MSLYSVTEIQKSRLVHHNRNKYPDRNTSLSHLSLIDENFATYFLKTKVKSEWCVILKSTCPGIQKSKNVVATC